MGPALSPHPPLQMGFKAGSGEGRGRAEGGGEGGGEGCECLSLQLPQDTLQTDAAAYSSQSVRDGR